MGRKGFGGKSAGVVNRRVLLRRLHPYSNHHQTLDNIVDHLRSTFPEYRRFHDRVLAKEVSLLLEESESHNRNQNQNPSPSSSKTPSYRDEGFGSTPRKKMKKSDEKEEKLLSRETQHLQRRHVGFNIESTMAGTSSSLSSSLSSSGSSSSSSDDDDEKDCALYEEKVEPEFDLTQLMLRRKYSENNAVAATTSTMTPGELALEEKNVEVEEVSEKPKKIDLVIGDRDPRGSGTSSESETKGLGSGGGGSSGELKEKKGPMFRDLGGMGSVLKELKMEVIFPLYHPQLPQWLGVRPMAGILLHGPPGCGKTRLAHAIANETGLPFYQISATEVVSGVSGASEENIRELFSKAYRTAPSIVFIDEVDAIASKRENLQREMEKRIVAQLMTCMDESHRPVKPVDGDRPSYVLVIGATNRPDAVDPALRRPGRFDREIALGVPDENARAEILSVLTRNLRLEGSFDLMKIARSTPGFVGADLAALTDKAGNLAMKRIVDRRMVELLKEPMDEENLDAWLREPLLLGEMEILSITMTDFEEAAKMVQPSSRREGFSTIPNVKWEDVGGLDCLREELDLYIVSRIRNPEDFKDFGVDMETGFLLYGPPGCGKTLIAQAVANEAGANFIYIKGPELLNKYVGESELAIRTIFSRARTCSPCIIFFDEVEALTTKRGKEGGWVVERLLNQLLIELDGADKRQGVFVIGATNRPDAMDPAILRPGRFGNLFYVPLPSPQERGLILKALVKEKPIDVSVDLITIGQMDACENLSGADLAALMNEAAFAAIKEKRLTTNSCSEAAPCTIKTVHFEQALQKVSPSVSKMQKLYFDNLSRSFRAA